MKAVLVILILTACFQGPKPKKKPKPHYTYVIRVYEGCFGQTEKVFGLEKDPVNYHKAYLVEHRGDTAIIHYDDMDILGDDDPKIIR